MALRVSSYIIPTQVADDKYILVHGYSGAIDIVSGEIGKFLSVNRNKDVLSDNLLNKEAVDYLMSRKYLVEKTQQEELEYVERLSNAIFSKDKILDASFTFIVTYNCNFRCPYCFEQNNTRDLYTHTLTKDAVDKAYSAIDKIIASRVKSNRYLTLFGGEPLLKENLGIVEYIVSEGKKRNFNFVAITNGFELEHFSHLLGTEGGIQIIQITLDGYDKYHDEKRPHYQEVPTFFTIIKNIELALEKSVKVTVRFNADKHNRGQIPKLENYFREKGLFNYENFSFYVSRLVNYDETKDDSDFFSQSEFYRLGEDTSNLHDFSAYDILANAIQNHKPIHYKANFCRAQICGHVFDPLYDIYPCWEIVGDKNNSIGDYSNGEICLHPDKVQIWRNKNVLSYEKCKLCPAALICGGGCVSKNMSGHKCLNMVDLVKKASHKIYKNLNTKNHGRETV